MRILVVSPYLPWPLWSGGNAAVFSTLKCLADDHRFTLFFPVMNPEQVRLAAELQQQLPRVQVRAIYCGAASLKMPLWKRICRKLLRELRSRFQEPAAVSELPYNPFQILPSPLIEAVNEELQRGVDIVQIEFAECMSLAGWLPAQLPKLFIHHQIHYMYTARYLAAHGSSPQAAYLEAVMKAQELAYLASFDGIITFSHQDTEILESVVDPKKLHTSPFPLPADLGVAQSLPDKFNHRFLFVASEEHAPNVDGLKWLLAEIWPRIISRVGDAKLLIIGKWRDETKQKLSGNGVEFTGFVSDLASTLRGGVMLVPIRIGSGIRVKILAALAQGVPVVTTTVGVEGIELKAGSEVLIQDDAAQFAESAIRLAQDNHLWLELSRAGQRALLKNYSPEQVRKRRNEIYRQLIAQKTKADFVPSAGPRLTQTVESSTIA